MKKEEIKEIIEGWKFATCPTEKKEPFFWKWNKHGLVMLIGYLQDFEKEVINEFTTHRRCLNCGKKKGAPLSDWCDECLESN